MVVAAPLTDVQACAELASFAADGSLTWWLFQGPDGAELGNALAALLVTVDRAGGGSWTGRLGGTPERLQFVTQHLDRARHGPDAHTGHRTEVVGLTSRQAVALLDRAETVAVDALLSLSADPSPLLAAAPGDQRRSGAVVMWCAGGAWAVAGLAGRRLPSLPGVVTSSHPVALPASRPVAEASPRARTGGAAAIAAAAAVIGVVALSAPFVSQFHHSPTQGATPARQAGRPGTAPEPENPPSLVYDQQRRNLLLFGGLEPTSSTWILAGNTWAAESVRPTPSDRFGAAIAYDQRAHTAVLFGGRERAGAIANDTWTWTGRRWELAAAGGPPGWEFSGMAWDRSHQQMVLVTPPNAGYADGHALTWTLGPRGWVRAASPDNPPAEPSSALSFDPATRTVLLVLSGLSPGATPSTWSWDGAAWHRLHPAHEPDLGGFTSFLTPLPATHQMLLARVSVSSPPALETWTWDGRDWTRQHPRVTPTGLVGLISDDAQARVLAIGHAPGAPGIQAAWRWTGSDWTRYPLQVGAKP